MLCFVIARTHFSWMFLLSISGSTYLWQQGTSHFLRVTIIWKWMKRRCCTCYSRAEWDEHCCTNRVSSFSQSPVITVNNTSFTQRVPNTSKAEFQVIASGEQQSGPERGGDKPWNNEDVSPPSQKKYWQNSSRASIKWSKAVSLYAYSESRKAVSWRYGGVDIGGLSSTC